MTYAVGLTGGIGSGKSAVADAFAALGIEVTDTDRLAHAITAAGTPGLDAIVAAFGATLLRSDGTLDRAALRRLAFGDPAARLRLESILHPLIAKAATDEIARWKSPYGIVVVPLLLERGGMRSRVQRILVVDCPEDEQVRRVQRRSALSEDEIRAIMATQCARAERLAARRRRPRQLGFAGSHRTPGCGARRPIPVAGAPARGAPRHLRAECRLSSRPQSPSP